MKTKNVAKKPRLDNEVTDGKPKPSKLQPLKEFSINNKSGSSSANRLSYPHLPVQDLTDFPKLNYVATANDPAVPIEDVDNLQTELETLLSVVTVCKSIIEAEVTMVDTLMSGGSSGGGHAHAPTSSHSLTPASVVSLLGEHYDQNHQEKINAVKSIIDAGHGTRTSVTAAAKLVMGLDPVPSTSTAANNNKKGGTPKGAGPSSRQPKKKLKDSGKEKPTIKAAARAGVNRSHSVSMDDSCLRLEAPNQFWEFADTFCRDVTMDDIERLERELEDHEEHPVSLSSIPPLGKYYDEANKGKMFESDTSDDVVGPLTQRLVSALVEDRSNCTANGSGDSSPETLLNLQGRKGLVKALTLDAEGARLGGNASQIPMEERLKQVLMEHDLFPNDPEEDLEDEVLSEIKRTLNTHQRLHDHNLKKMRNLLAVAKAEYTRIQKKKDLEKADKEIIDAYRTINSLRIKRKPVTQKERTQAKKALANRQAAVDALSEVDTSIKLLTNNGNAN